MSALVPPFQTLPRCSAGNPASLLPLQTPPSEAQQVAAPLPEMLRTTPMGYLRLGPRTCQVISLLPPLRVTRSCFALFIKPGFVNSAGFGLLHQGRNLQSRDFQIKLQKIRWRLTSEGIDLLAAPTNPPTPTHAEKEGEREEGRERTASQHSIIIKDFNPPNT